MYLIIHSRKERISNLAKYSSIMVNYKFGEIMHPLAYNLLAIYAFILLVRRPMAWAVYSYVGVSVHV